MTPATTVTLAAEHERLARYIHGHFKRKLTRDDADDAASEALAEAARSTETIRDRDKWLRRAAWRNALDQIRRVEGEGQMPRERPAGLGDDVDLLPASDSTEGTLIAAALHDADSRALARAAKSLKPDEHRVLHLRYIDGLDVGTILELVGCSRHHYDNLHKRGLRKLRDALVAPATTPACREARGLVLASALGGLADHDAARRDAHLEGCLACRAFSKRRDGLIAALPLPAVPAVLSRIGAFFAGGAAPAKVVAVCGAGACAAVAPIAAPVVEREVHHRPAHHKAAEDARAPAPAARIATPTTTATVTTTARAVAPRAAPKTKARAKREPERSSSALKSSSPFLPESSSPPVVVAPRATTSAVTREPSPAPRRSAPHPSSFADEFTP